MHRSDPACAAFFCDSSSVRGYIVLAMVRKKKKTFSATKAVKSAARAYIGTPRPTRAVSVLKKKTTEKHKPTLGKLLEIDD